jgi:hypothetical protein
LGKNWFMEIDGLVQNGVVTLPGGEVLPEGMRVTVSFPLPASKEAGRTKRRISLPLVPSSSPGALSMTAERVAELLEDADVSS